MDARYAVPHLMKLRTKLLLLLFALVVVIDLLLMLNSLRGCSPRASNGRKLAEARSSAELGWFARLCEPLPV